jgi:AbiU2
MTDQTASEAKAQYIQTMGEALGKQFHALWQEIALLHINWKEYMALFGTNEKRIERLNLSAPAFFRMIQDELWSATLLHIARLLDSPKTGGQGNLSVRNFTDLVDQKLKMPLAALIDKAVADAKFARDWRNKVIAHQDLALALQDGSAKPLTSASRKDVDTALKSLSAVMNCVQKHYLDGGTTFDAAARHNGALTLLYLLGDGLKAKSEREAALQKAIEGGSDEEMRAAMESSQLQEQI